MTPEEFQKLLSAPEGTKLEFKEASRLRRTAALLCCHGQ